MASIFTLPSELLEHILYFLPERDLLFSILVCKSWRELLRNSSYLQQALFLQPEKPHLAVRYVNRCEHNRPDVETYSIVATTDGKPGRFSGRQGASDTCFYQEASVLVGRLNPFIVSRSKPSDRCVGGVPGILYEIGSARIGIKLLPCSFHALRSQEAGRMFLTQPPITEIEYAWNFLRPMVRHGHDGTREEFSARATKFGSIVEATGLTLAHVLHRISTLEAEIGGCLDQADSGHIVAFGITDLTLQQQALIATMEKASVKESSRDLFAISKDLAITPMSRHLRSLYRHPSTH